MGAIARLDDQLQQGGLGRQVRKSPLMRDFDDVGAGFSQESRDRGELARPVDDIEAELGQPPLARELAGQNRGDQAAVDVAASQD